MHDLVGRDLEQAMNRTLGLLRADELFTARVADGMMTVTELEA